MLRLEFDQIFEDEITRPLEGRGFKIHGKTLDLFDSNCHVSFVRLGGRMVRPSAPAWVLCFRHTFLRLVQPESDASKLRFAVHDYPYKFTVSELRSRRTPLRYHSRLLRFDYDQFDYSTLDSATTKSELAAICVLILDVFVPWAVALSFDQAQEELERFGVGGWCEKRWMEDYDIHLRDSAAPN